MRMRARSVLVIVAATFAAACGEGGGGDAPAVTPTSPPSPTATPTRTVTTAPTATLEIPIEPCFEGPSLGITARSLPGADLDVGWTGIWHDLSATHENLVSAALVCPGGNFCAIDGSNLVGRSIGAPLPLSAGGVSLCVLPSFREAMTGTYDCNGCSELSAKLSVRVFPPEDADMPCPACVGDPTPNDGRKRGTCRGGTTPGAACDVGASSDLVSGIDGVSNDCLPARSSIGELDVDVTPLTTATVVVDADVDCVSTACRSASCFCPGQVQPNSCAPDGLCPPSGICESGPIDSVCDGQPARRCRSGTGAEDCEARIPGAGSCVDRPRPCFGSRIARTGVCGTDQGQLVSIFCVPATGAAAVDTMVGLPGPAAIRLPVALVRTLR